MRPSFFPIGSCVTFIDRERKDMTMAQTQLSLETSRDIKKDKTLKSTAEKERRLREKKSNNTKLFIDERKTAAQKQAKRQEKLKKIHEDQMNDLLKYIQSVRKGGF